MYFPDREEKRRGAAILIVSAIIVALLSILQLRSFSVLVYMWHCHSDYEKNGPTDIPKFLERFFLNCQ